MLIITQSVFKGKMRKSLRKGGVYELTQLLRKVRQGIYSARMGREKNAPLTPESVARTSTIRVWWKCEKSHFWQTQISSRAKANSGCPICLREKIDARMDKRRAAEAEKKR